MKFPLKYKCLGLFEIKKENYKLVPIRYEDRIDIIKWRNEQMYHLRQAEKLTEQAQDKYFSDFVAKLFEQEKPNQILFSYLKDDVCIGYGGLVHINWIDKNAEISFIMDTKLEKNEFELHWSNFLFLLKKLAFTQLKFNTIFTYAYNLRPHLYPVLEKNDFKLKEKLVNEIEIERKKVDVLIHQCHNPINLITVRKANSNDVELVFNWSNDKLVRSQSFNSNEINIEEHTLWFVNKSQNTNSLLLINQLESEPIGLVRFEIEETHTVVGLLLDKKQRGRGLSHLMLMKSCEKYFESFKTPILAYIKTTNVASVKSFEKAGFKFYKNDTVNEIPTLVYKLNKDAE
jgi:RimJ/RimL family protein N-acetyltransferase